MKPSASIKSLSISRFRPLFVGAARVIGRGPFRKLIKAGRHRDKLARLQFANAQVNGAASIMFRTALRVCDKLPLIFADDIPE